MQKSLNKALPELLDAGVIDDETVARIEEYYHSTSKDTSSYTILVFSVLGAIIVGLGLVLIIAHNWDAFPKNIRLLFTFLPLLASQIFVWIAIKKHRYRRPIIESSSLLLFFAIPACISLVSQIYHINGQLEDFLLLWLLLSWPLIFVPGANIVSLLFVIISTWYACQITYFTFRGPVPWLYWALILIPIAKYARDIYKDNFKRYRAIGGWIIAISLTLVLGGFSAQFKSIMTPAYLLFFGLILILHSAFITSQDNSWWMNPWRSIGKIGVAIVALILSFGFFWQELPHYNSLTTNLLNSTDSISFITLLLMLIVGIWYLKRYKHEKFLNIFPELPAVIVLVLIYGAGFFMPMAGQLLSNLALLAMGVFYIFFGYQRFDLSRANYGMVLITSLAIARFFDAELSFVLRGSMFVLVGLGFFMANFFIIKKQKAKG